MRARLSVVVLFALAADLHPASADPQQLRPRVPVDKRTHARLPETAEIERVVVKFHEGTAVRLRGGNLTVQDRGERDRRDLAAHKLAPEAVRSDAAEVQRLASLEGRGLRRLFTLSETVLADRRVRGEARSGRQLADLDLYYELPLKPGTRARDVDALLDSLNALKSVEIAYAQPPAQPAVVATSASGPTPDFRNLQGYLDTAPQGIDAHYAWTQPGGKGQGVRIVDIEGGWRTTHEDLPPLFHTRGAQFESQHWRNHGTAVLGQLVGKDNGLGVTGIAHQAQAGYESIESQDTGSAVLSAAQAAGVGGIVLIELHFYGPTGSSPCTCNEPQCYFVPAEFFQGHFDAIANATANGTVVVEAGGNGSANLDDPLYGGIFQRSIRDSGAILVGASNSSDRAPACWTNWGSRIDLHGWGDSVVTLGTGDLFDGGEDRWYTASFSGTSSASPIVTGAAASLQGRALALFNAPLEPLYLRELLAGTGTPQTGDRNIGPLPNLRAAFAAVLDYEPPTCYTLTRTQTGQGEAPAVSRASSPGCPAGQYKPGTQIELTAVPAEGWEVKGWTGTADDATVSIYNSMTMPAGAATVAVQYAAIPETALANGSSRDGSFQAALSQSTWRYYYVDLQPGSGNLVVDLLNTGQGDLDLYVRYGARPTVSQFDCRPYMGTGTDEQCVFPATGAGRWWIGVNNFSTGTLSYRVGASWTVTPLPPQDFYTLPPCRLLDTRPGTPLVSGMPQSFYIAGSCGVPYSAKAVAVNITVLDSTAQGNVALWPGDQVKPLASAINVSPGQVRAGNAILPLASDGSGSLSAQSFVSDGGTVHLLLDVAGWFE